MASKKRAESPGRQGVNPRFVGEKINAAMRRQGMKQAQVAVAVGVAQGNVSTWATGTKVPVLGNLRALAVLLHASVDEFLGVEEMARNFAKGVPLAEASPDGVRLGVAGEPELSDDDLALAELDTDEAKAIEVTKLPLVDDRYRALAPDVIRGSQMHPRLRKVPLSTRWDFVLHYAARHPVTGIDQALILGQMRQAFLDEGTRRAAPDEADVPPESPRPPEPKKRRRR